MFADTLTGYLQECIDKTGIVSKALLTFSNKDAYARIRQFLNYLAEKGIIEMDLSRTVPHYKRGRCFLRHIRQMKSAGSKLLLILILLLERETLRSSDWHHEWDSVQATLQSV